MSTGLVPVNSSARQDRALAVAASVDYLPRIKLCQGSAKEVAKKKVKAGGNFALIRTKDDIEDLGDEVEMVMVAGRPKAMSTGDTILSIFEDESPEFKQLQADSKVKDSGCFYGAEYLVYLPSHACFATLFLNNPTARRETGAFHSRLGGAALLCSHYIDPEGSKFAWWGPLCKDLTTPIADLPEPDEFIEQATKFNTEKSTSVKAAESNEDSGRDR